MEKVTSESFFQKCRKTDEVCRPNKALKSRLSVLDTQAIRRSEESGLKVEQTYRKNIQTHEEMKNGIFTHMVVFYDRKKAFCQLWYEPAVFEESTALAA